jgi:hypothetical protein
MELPEEDNSRIRKSGAKFMEEKEEKKGKKGN